MRYALGIFKYLKPSKPLFILGFIVLILGTFTFMAFPILLGQLIGASGVNEVNNADQAEVQSMINKARLGINQVAIWLVSAFCLQAIFSFLRVYVFALITENMMLNLRQAIYKHTIIMPMKFFSSRRVGELSSRISADINQLQEAFTNNLAEFIRQFITIGVGLGYLLYNSPQLTFIMLGIIPIIAISAVFFGRFIRRLSKQTQEEIATSNVIVEETFTSISSVKSFTNEFYETLRYARSTQNIKNIALKGAKWRSLFISFIILCMFGSIVFLIWYALQINQTNGRELVTFIIMTAILGASFAGIPELYSKIQKSLGATENLLDLLHETPEPLKERVEEVDLKVNGNIEFKDVEFSYPSRPDIKVLNQLNLSIKSGEQVAIVGSSGAGKSTIINLVLRFFDINSGTITVDEKPIENFDLHELRNQMAVVPQEVLLFGGTIRENIAYGKPNATLEEIEQAAKDANALDFINEFPEKLETLVGERGIQLSGGQRQRIAIARAVLKNPSILLLDEATSALDSESESVVQEALARLMKSRTSIVVAHRLSTIIKSDKIFVLQAGKVAEMGTHKELIASKDGIYKHLTEIQLET